VCVCVCARALACVRACVYGPMFLVLVSHDSFFNFVRTIHFQEMMVLPSNRYQMFELTSKGGQVSGRGILQRMYFLSPTTVVSPAEI
jgi:hypothetical protein